MLAANTGHGCSISVQGSLTKSCKKVAALHVVCRSRFWLLMTRAARVSDSTQQIAEASAGWSWAAQHAPDEAVDPDPQRPHFVAAAAEAAHRQVALRVRAGPDTGQQRGQGKRKERGARQQRRRRGRPEEALRAAAEQRQEVGDRHLRSTYVCQTACTHTAEQVLHPFQ